MLPDRQLVLRYTLQTAGPTGAWGFGDPPDQLPSVLPTALALLTLLACDPALATTWEAVRRAARWLVTRQNEDGSFPVEPIPPAIWYLGPVYVTSVAALALAGLAKVG